MYCIINPNKDIIAADKEFFFLLKLDNIMELYRQIASGDIDIAFEEDRLIINNSVDTRSYTIKSFEIDGLLSQSKIIEVLPEIANDDIETDQETSDKQENKPSDDGFDDFDEFILEEIIFHEAHEPKKETHYQTANAQTQHESEYKIHNFDDIGLDDKSQETSIPADDETTKHFNETDQEASKIDINAEEIGQKIGLSKTDYILFLQEYIKTVKSLKNDLENHDDKIQKSAVSFITHLSDVLGLPEDISNLVESLNSSVTKKNIDKFYDAINKISTNNEASPTSLENTDLKQEDIDRSQEKSETSNNENLEQKPACLIDLSDVTPIEFDFILEEAAKELSLPNEIVKDFIKDFIEQCHTETGNLLDSYEKGDIESAKKIARLLKGVAKNLYIAPLAKSLFELHSNDDIEQVEPLVKKYWAQFLSFENIMKNA